MGAQWPAVAASRDATVGWARAKGAQGREATPALRAHELQAKVRKRVVPGPTSGYKTHKDECNETSPVVNSRF